MSHSLEKSSDWISAYVAEKSADPTSTLDLIIAAQKALQYRDSDNDIEADQYWNPISTLHCRDDDEVLSASARLVRDEEASSRILGASILSQVNLGNPSMGEVAAKLLGDAIQTENDPDVLISLAYALGHTPHLPAAPGLVDLIRHPSNEVRMAVAYALPMHNEFPEAIWAMIELSRDEDDDVRDWATFDLGSLIDDDTPEIRAALLERLEDTNANAAGEAMVGLAKRGDARVLPYLLRAMRSLSPVALKEATLLADAATECIQAAEHCGDSTWLPLLYRLEQISFGDQARVRAAINRCKSSE